LIYEGLLDEINRGAIHTHQVAGGCCAAIVVERRLHPGSDTGGPIAASYSLGNVFDVPMNNDGYLWRTPRLFPGRPWTKADREAYTARIIALELMALLCEDLGD
jgi:hypothetical protein